MTEILNAHILVVDDQPANTELLYTLLTDAGYRNVTCCTDPCEVYDLHHDNVYDLILLDLQMPVMDGFEVMERLKTITTDDYLPVIVLTAQPNHKIQALRAGAKDFISKPFDLVEVKLRIHNMLEVRLLHRQIKGFNKVLEATVAERTKELRESELRYRCLTELATDWFWEQDAEGTFTRLSGPVLEMLGLAHESSLGWNEIERTALQEKIAAREPIVDFEFSKVEPDGLVRRFLVSGEPIFDRQCSFVGYRGVGLQRNAKASRDGSH
jgi:DNA-binding response OmpR family regulator